MNLQPEQLAPVASRELTFGEKAVGLTFNPSGDDAVTRCKQGFAAVIDQMHSLRTAAQRTQSNDPADNQKQADIARMASVAITEAQTAQMWAVKAITWRG